MFDKLYEAEKKYESIGERLLSPEVTSDIDAYRRLMKEYKSLSPIIEKFREYKKAKEELDEANGLLLSNDRDLRELAGAELPTIRETLGKISDELKLLLIPKDPNDDKNVIIEIRSGAGGEEAALFAADLYRIYGMYSDKMGFKAERISENETELGGFSRISFSVEGDGAYSRFKFESGVHRVQRVPVTESQGRIQTSTVTVAVLPEAEEVEIEINPADLEIESCKSSGAGGQHINKTESAVRITHKPSGIVVECQEERSQFKNKDKAMKMLRAKLYDIKQREVNDKITSERRSQVGSGDRSEKIRTYNYHDSRVTDHRIKMNFSLQSILEGDIGNLIDALIAADTAEKLRSGSDDE